MEKIKVYIQYPWGFPDSPYYKYLVKDYSKNIEYLNAKKYKGVHTNSKKLFLSHLLKRSIRKFIRMLNIQILNAHLTEYNKKYDLIHCAHCLSLNKNKPWVADFEGIWQIYFENKNNDLKIKIMKILLRDECKKILPWSFKVKEDILKEFPEIKDKIEVVYPAMPLPKIKRKKHERINLLFVGRYFYRKGGLHALESIDRLTKKHKSVYGIFISGDIPKIIMEKYSKNPKILFYKLISQNKLLEEVYPITDIFVYPGYRDSFGFAFIETMAFGIPTVTIDGFARKEIIENGKTGFIIDKKILKSEIRIHNEEIVKEIVKKTEILIKDKKLRNKMSKNCVEIIKNGKFSIKERNKKLKRIYEEAVKN